jgi:hypothetical protein
MKYLQETSIKTIKIYTVISALNCLQLAPLLEWMINTVNLHGRKVIWSPIVLDSPEYQRVTALPLATRSAAADQLAQQFTTAAWPEHFCDYQHGLSHTLAALRSDEALPAQEGLHKLREWLFYDWHLRRQHDHIKPNQYWNSVLPELAAELQWTPEDWKQHEQAG